MTEPGLRTVPEDEFLYIDTLRGLVEKMGGEGGNALLHHDGFDIDALFSREDGPPHVFSACHDGVVSEQALDHPARDIEKFLPVIDWAGIAETRDRYPQIRITSVRDGRCDPAHRYSVKTDRFTWLTFPSFPKWVKGWWTVNANVADRRVRLLPFGLNTDGPGSSYVKDFQGADKDRLVYVNFQWNSHRRIAIKREWRNRRWATYEETPNVPVRDYLREMARHKFVLCPAGNGLDQYRIYEALYLGCVPVVEESVWARRMTDTGLPVLSVSDMNQLTPQFLNEVWGEVQKRVWDYRWATRSYWAALLANLAGGTTS